MVVRNADGVVFYALENIVNFMDRQKANEDVARRLIRKIPNVPKEGTYFIGMDNVDELFPNTGSSFIGFVGLISASTTAITDYYTKKYIVEFISEDKESLSFLYGESIEQFLIKNLVNYSGFRRKVK